MVLGRHVGHRLRRGGPFAADVLLFNAKGTPHLGLHVCGQLIFYAAGAQAWSSRGNSTSVEHGHLRAGGLHSVPVLSDGPLADPSA